MRHMRRAVQRTATHVLHARNAALAAPRRCRWLAGSGARHSRAHPVPARSLSRSVRRGSGEARRPRLLRADRGRCGAHHPRPRRARGLRTAVKSKSMISEEIELNPALEADGVHVVETDLGEFVVQLDQDRPSHIVAPIIHKTKEDVAPHFRDKLGATDDDVADVPHMTQFARRVLRSAFLEADIGISGVNFGVAETGSICICTNEGNGRLTTTLPRVHVAMMGMERLVPTRRRSGRHAATCSRGARPARSSRCTRTSSRVRGAPANPTAPRSCTSCIVDNGRSEVLGGELAEILYCIRCGACLNACPVYQQIGGHAYGSVYSGPVGRRADAGRSAASADFHDLPHASSLCGACREVCPVRIDIPRMLLALRAADASSRANRRCGSRSACRRLAGSGTRPALFRPAGPLAAAMARTGWRRDGWMQSNAGTAGRLDAVARFPGAGGRIVHDRWRREQPPEAMTPPGARAHARDLSGRAAQAALSAATARRRIRTRAMPPRQPPIRRPSTASARVRGARRHVHQASGARRDRRAVLARDTDAQRRTARARLGRAAHWAARA